MAPLPRPAAGDETSDALKALSGDFAFMLSKLEVEPETQAYLGFHGVRSAETFSQLAGTAAELKTLLEEDFGISIATGGFAARLQISRLTVAWEKARTRATRYAEAEAESDLQRQPKTLPLPEFSAMRRAYEAAHGKLAVREVPAKGYIELLSERVEKQDWKPEALSEVVDDTHAEQREVVGAFDPSSGKWKTERRVLTRALPSDTEEFRERLTLLGTAWVMLRTSLPGVSALKDLTPKAFDAYQKHLLGKEVYKIGQALRVEETSTP